MEINTYLCTSDNHQVQLQAETAEGALKYFTELHGEDGNVEVLDCQNLFSK